MKVKKTLYLFIVLIAAISTYLAVGFVIKPKISQIGLGAILGDCGGPNGNPDGFVDLFDYGNLSRSFGLTQGQSGFNAACDFYVDSHNIIDLLDYGVLAQNFGRTVSVSQSPTPSPQVSSGVSVVTVGDIACGPDTLPGSPCREWATSEVARQATPDTYFILGDNQYEAGQYQYFTGQDPFCQSNPPRCYSATWGRLKSKTHPVVGNHEYGTANARGYFDYFNGSGTQTGPAGDKDKGYYSFNIGNWHIVVLNSNCTKVAGGCGTTSAQVNWLKSDLSQNSGACTLAMMHHSRFSSGHDGNNSGITASLIPIWQTLYDANVDVVLGGHSHDYERFAPQKPDGTLENSRGIRQFVIGTGGRDFTGWAWNAPNSQIKQNNTFGVLKLNLKSTSYDWQFLPIAGSSFTDSGSANCH